MSWLLAAPIVIPFTTAVLAFLFRNGPEGRWISIIGSACLLIASGLLMQAVLADGVIAGQMGNWPAPFGITLVADLLSAVMVVITGVTGLAVAIYALADIESRLEKLGYHALFQVLLAGVCGAFLTGDLFNLYVWFEVMLIASFGLLILGGRRQQLDGGIKYVTINLVSTILFLAGIGLLYGMTGTLNLADLHLAVQEVENKGLLTVVAVMFMVAFGVKAAVFPLFFWLPASYHTPSVAVSAIFAGLLTKVGVYALIRMFTLVFTEDVEYTHTILLWIAGFTMVTGVLGAAAMNDFRRILSFHIVSQIGYMILGLALFTPLALVGSVFYLVHHIIVKANLFLVAGVARRIAGSTELSAIGGLYKTAPVLGLLFLIPAFSLAGFPPLSGFWAKYILVKASLDLEMWLIAGVALVVGLLTIYSMTKIWGSAFWKPHPAGLEPKLGSLSNRDRTALILPIASLAILTCVIGLFPEPFVQFAERAADQLLSPTDYVQTVLGLEATQATGLAQLEVGP
ncbi:Na+/H+ antiporter subunit D [Roseobacter sp. HKCCD9010]|uniref:Na+/H+ antiporter subunit D n=1 Tax=unclassified Roseobacter TaxID=196798 RepID=UPI0014910D72|nr:MULTISPECIES: Na+/H+ antiporter subunit D [unclassified Roseobacter]MBF9048853.1 Na+/H+ antiporter subunit D [Rhodobacterales bacterium HKCCD4356]NNV10852.1 Na+/H+ antiporter subunit D [Roseobacter sp. HKCCD7357]NNV15037.1 Na+/H+ antiporter subunit D [Roseobacter sp. HKCCD8768]NNV24496.1 Na+/H+ antiporter subunit D [Roseobacter sp. HKCCD8192]NNV28753.1 Na+/H+ antiporter subunit D [Roseobacter sp. HKCCD9061]